MPEAPELTQKLKNPTSEPEVSEPRLDANKPEYPTDAQMEAVFNGYLKGGAEGIRKALERLYPKSGDKDG